MDQAEHQPGVGRVLARLLGLAAHLPLQLSQETLVAGILLNGSIQPYWRRQQW